MHAEYTIRGAKAGKHVLCEKPMANTPQDCQAMIDAARAANRKLMVGYRLRYEPYNQAMIKMAREQELGPVKVILADARLQHRRPEPVAAQAGHGRRRLADGHRHLRLQAARYLTGEEPTEVNAMSYTHARRPALQGGRGDDQLPAALPERRPRQLRLELRRAGLNRFRVLADKGWFELEPALSYTGLRMRVRRGGATEDRDLPQRDHFALEMDHMSECVMANSEPLTPGEEGLRDLKLMMAIYEAAKANKAVKL